MYVWGGRNDRAPCSVLFKFDTFWHCWMAPPTTGSAPMARDGHSACVWKNYMFLLGGYEDETDTFAKMVFYLDLERLHWSYAICDGNFLSNLILENILKKVLVVKGTYPRMKRLNLL